MRFVIKPGGTVVLLIAMVGLTFLAFTRKERVVEKLVEKSIVQSASALPTTATDNLIQDGTMDDNRTENNVPAAWKDVWTEHGTISAIHDTKIFKSAPSSLRITSADGNDLKGQVSQRINAHSGQVLHVQGFLKTEGDIRAIVGLQSFNKRYEAIDSQQAVYKQDTGDWMPFKTDLTVPKGIDHINVIFFVQGKGKAWLDDLTVYAKK